MVADHVRFEAEDEWFGMDFMSGRAEDVRREMQLAVHGVFPGAREPGDGWYAVSTDGAVTTGVVFCGLSYLELA